MRRMIQGCVWRIRLAKAIIAASSVIAGAVTRATSNALIVQAAVFLMCSLHVSAMGES